MKLKNPKNLQEMELEVENTNPIVDGREFTEEDDDTVFYFTNSSDEDFTTQWNKVEYTFPAKRRTRMAIRGESPENVQSIRKMFAERYAIQEFQKTREFVKRNTPIEGQRPVAYSLKVLQPFIDSCLKPLPKAKLISREVVSEEDGKFQGDTKPLDDSSNAPYEVFKDSPVRKYGEMSSD